MIQHETSCLGAATYHGATELVRFLLESGAQVNSTDGSRITALTYAVVNDSLDTVELLISYGADLDAVSYCITKLHYYIEILRPQLLHLMTEFVRGESCWGGETPLQTLILNYQTNLEIAKLLLDNGADVNAVNNHGWTALHFAAQEEKYAVANFLLQNGASRWARTSSGETPLLIAVKSRLCQLSNELLTAEADVAARFHPDELRSALQYAMGSFCWETAILLLKAGADFDAKDDLNKTPLHHASKYGGSEVVKLLLRLGADVDARTPKLATPLHLAALNGKLAVAKLLLNAGANVNSRTESNKTPLHYAARIDEIGVAKLLIEEGADVEATDAYGHTPLEFAMGLGEGIWDTG